MCNGLLMCLYYSGSKTNFINVNVPPRLLKVAKLKYVNPDPLSMQEQIKAETEQCLKDQLEILKSFPMLK